MSHTLQTLTICKLHLNKPVHTLSPTHAVCRGDVLNVAPIVLDMSHQLTAFLSSLAPVRTCTVVHASLPIPDLLSVVICKDDSDRCYILH